MAVSFSNFRIMGVSKDAKGGYMKLEIQLPERVVHHALGIRSNFIAN